MNTRRGTYLFYIIVSVAFLFTLVACKESSLAPLDVNGKLDSFVGRQWILTADESSVDDTTVSQRGWVLDLRTDGSYSASGPATPSSNGRWVYNPIDSTITLVSADGKARVSFVLDSVAGASAILKKAASNETFVFKQKSDPLFSVSGDVLFENDVAIPSSRSLHVVWKMMGASDRYLVWGSGSIDELSNSFRVDYNSYPPDSVVQRFFGCNGKFGIGHIVVLRDGEKVHDGSVISGPLITRIAAIVKDRAIVFVFGRISDTPCARTFPWTSWFSSGFNLGESLSISTGSAFYRPTQNSAASLVFSDDAVTLQTPVWWQ